MKDRYRITKREYQFDYEGKEYQAEVEIEIHCEDDYGADADGNRGRYDETIESINVERLFCTEDKDEKTVEVTDKIYDIIEAKVVKDSGV